MTVHRSIAVAAATALTVALAAPAAAADGPAKDYLVVSAGLTTASLSARADIQRAFPSVGAAVVSMTDAEAQRLDRDPTMVVTEDGAYRVGEVKPNGHALDSRSTPTVTNPSYQVRRSAASWGLDRVDQREGTNGAYRTRPGVDGRGVHVYVIDSGLAVDHPEFAGRVGNGVDFVGDGRGVRDCDGHGTHVAGTIASTRFGVAAGAIVHPVRVVGCDGSGSMSDFVAALDWVKRNAPRASVANASGGGYYNAAVNQAVNNFVDSGTPLVVAAGNDADDIASYSPASAPKATTVMAIDPDDGEAPYTNYGPEGDIFAPGTDIWSTYHADPGKKLRATGTSMAAPHVTGYLALRLQLRPGELVKTTIRAMRRQSTKDAVDTYLGGYTRNLVYTYAVAHPLTVRAKAVRNASQLRVNVDPDVGKRSWTIRVQQRRNGDWATITTTQTRRPSEIRTINISKGRYRVVVPAGQHGYTKRATSAKVVIRR